MLINGQLFSLLFSQVPRTLGKPDSIEVVSVTVHVDPMVSRVDAGIEQRLGELDPTVRAELEQVWASDPPDDRGLAAPDETYRIQLDDGDYLVLGQLADTSFLAAPIDPPRPGVRRFWPDGQVLGEYADVRAALEDA